VHTHVFFTENVHSLSKFIKEPPGLKVPAHAIDTTLHYTDTMHTTLHYIHNIYMLYIAYYTTLLTHILCTHYTQMHTLYTIYCKMRIYKEFSNWYSNIYFVGLFIHAFLTYYILFRPQRIMLQILFIMLF